MMFTNCNAPEVPVPGRRLRDVPEARPKLHHRCLPVFLAVLVALSGCAPVLSSQVRREAAPHLSFAEVLRNPNVHMGKLFIWSGTILETENTPDVTVITVLQNPSDREGRPRDLDVSEGRFLARVQRYLDPAIYAEGRLVTVAGELTGTEVRPLGAMDYTYPILEVKEIHLWPKPVDRYPAGVYPRYYWGWHSFWWY